MPARVNRPYKKFGRKRKEAPPNVATAKLIEALAADGRSIIGIAKTLGISKQGLHGWMDEDESLLEAFERGREQERQALHNKLYLAAMKGNVIAAFFLLKSRHGYREGDQSDTANKVSITFTLPGAMKPEEFMKTVEHEPANTDKQLPEKVLIRTRRV